MTAHWRDAKTGELKPTLRAHLTALRSVFAETPRTVRLVLSVDPRTAISIVLVGLVSALGPLAVAYIGKLIVDGVVLALRTRSSVDARHVVELVLVEFGVMIATGLLAQISSYQRTVLGVKLGHLINLRILKKAVELDLAQLENSEINDKLQNARREASARPLNVFMNSVGNVGNVITLVSYGALLIAFNGLALVVLVVATLPAFLVEARFSNEAFRLFSWRAPEGRRLRYLEVVLTQDAYAKEVKLYGLSGVLLGRYRALYEKLFGEELALAARRAVSGFGLGLVSTAAFYGCYAWIALRALEGELTLGDMTLYITVFRQGQTALRSILKSIGTMYEDNLFMSNLFSFLELPVSPRKHFEVAPPALDRARTGFVLERVSFRYPGADDYALKDIDLDIGPAEKIAIVGDNGAGKSTLIKLLTGLYAPTEGAIRLDGVPLDAIDPEEMRRRFGVVLQDYVRYQFIARDNVALGNVGKMDDRARIDRAAELGGAAPIIERLPFGWETQLGRWFEGGVDLSAGEWQKLAVSRAFMRDADILILDEPSASLDVEAEHALFERFKRLAEGRMALLISHRFSTVRMADRIIVLRGGSIEEMGSHVELIAKNGRYAQLFRLQAAGYGLADQSSPS